MIAVKV